MEFSTRCHAILITSKGYFLFACFLWILPGAHESTFVNGLWAVAPAVLGESLDKYVIKIYHNIIIEANSFLQSK
jgi:hypothetical protein